MPLWDIWDGGQAPDVIPATASFPEYVVELLTPNLNHYVGETVNFQWAISRTDGGDVPIPTSTIASVVLNDGLPDTGLATIVIDTDTPSPQITLTVSFTSVTPGYYAAQFLAYLGASPSVQIVGDWQKANVLPIS